MKRRTFVKSAASVAGSLCLSGASEILGATRRLDLIVYGSTASGIMAAVAAARQGLSVALLDSVPHVGGMMTAGLSYTDYGTGSTIGGLAREFFTRISQHYNVPEVWGPEPHVTEEVFKSMLREAKIHVRLDTRLRQFDGVVKEGARITRLIMESGEAFEAKQFADCTYEGDLMHAAHVSNTWGRESASQYGESLAGVLGNLREDLQFRAKVSPYAKDGSLLPGVSKAPRGKLGEADKKIPAYNYRLCFSKDRENQVPFHRPDGYDSYQYELLARYLPELQRARGRELILKDAFLIEPLQRGKADFNNMGAFSTDYIGTKWDYPTATYARREQFARELYRFDAGLLYFISTDPRVPGSLQRELNSWGLAKDEFVDHNNWPWRVYVRECRRMLGEHVFTQHDSQDNNTKKDTIAVGSYWLDSHHVQRVAGPDGAVENEGDMFVAVEPYEVPYRSILPKRAEATNLLVPVCVSATHAAYGTIRQEPVFMMLGQAVGTAAAIAVRGNHQLQDVPIAELQQQLVSDKAILQWSKPTE